MSSPEVLILKELAHDQPAPGLLGLAERGLLPDTLLRLGVRQQCAARLRGKRRRRCGAGGAPAAAARAAARKCGRPAYRRRQRAALRAAAAVLPAVSRAAPEVLLRLLRARR